MTWTNPEPTTLPDGTKQFPHEENASIFQMHAHLIDDHGHQPFPEGFLTTEEMIHRHASAHNRASAHTHDGMR
jgi:hypothetical protein